METIDFRKKLQLAETLIQDFETEASIRESGQLLEAALRKMILKLITADLPFEEITAIQETVGRIGGGKKSIHSFGFGQLIGVYREAKIERILRREFESNFKRTRSIDWNLAVEWRNAVVHQKTSTLSARSIDFPDEDDAMAMIRWAKSFIYDCELLTRGTDGSADKKKANAAPAGVCSECGFELMEEWKFCPMCSRPTKLECHCCKNPVQPNWKVCPFCEEPLAAKMETADELRARWEYATICKGAWADGVVNPEERAYLDKIQLELGIPASEAHEIEEKVAPEELIAYQHHVEGFLVDGEITAAERAFLDRMAERLNIPPYTCEAIEASMLHAENSRVRSEI